MYEEAVKRNFDEIHNRCFGRIKYHIVKMSQNFGVPVRCIDDLLENACIAIMKKLMLGNYDMERGSDPPCGAVRFICKIIVIGYIIDKPSLNSDPLTKININLVLSIFTVSEWNIKGKTADERKETILLYLDGFTKKEIAQELNREESWVSKIIIDFFKDVAKKRPDLIQLTEKFLTMDMSKEEINYILKKIEKKIANKAHEKVDETYVPTDEQIKKGYKAALVFREQVPKDIQKIYAKCTPLIVGYIYDFSIAYGVPNDVGDDLLSSVFEIINNMLVKGKYDMKSGSNPPCSIVGYICRRVVLDYVRSMTNNEKLTGYDTTGEEGVEIGTDDESGEPITEGHQIPAPDIKIKTYRALSSFVMFEWGVSDEKKDAMRMFLDGYKQTEIAEALGHGNAWVFNTKQEFIRAVAEKKPDYITELGGGINIKISDERINYIIKKIEEKIAIKDDGEVDEAYLPTDEQMEKAYHAAIDYLDKYSPSLLEQVEAILNRAGESASKGFMLPGKILKEISDLFVEPGLSFSLGPGRDFSRQPLDMEPISGEPEESVEYEDKTAAVKAYLHHLEQHKFRWYSAGVVDLERRLIIGLRHLDVFDYEADSVKVPEIEAASQLDVGGIRLVEVKKAPNWIRVRIDADKPYPPIHEIGIRVNQDPENENKLKLTLEKIS
jgi:hypothetical protein